MDNDRVDEGGEHSGVRDVAGELHPLRDGAGDDGNGDGSGDHVS